MKPLLLLLLLLPLPSCATETRVIRDNSASSKFASMFGGKASAGGEASGGFQMTRNDGPGAGQNGQASAQALEIARILRGGAPTQAVRENPQNVRVITSFQTDEPAPKPGQPAGAPNAPSPANQGEGIPTPPR